MEDGVDILDYAIARTGLKLSISLPGAMLIRYNPVYPFFCDPVSCLPMTMSSSSIRIRRRRRVNVRLLLVLFEPFDFCTKKSHDRLFISAFRQVVYPKFL
jgi:hypothetical protein